MKNHKPLFPFGHGLSYTEFAYSDLVARLEDGALEVSFTLKNGGTVEGKDVAQVYASPTTKKWAAPQRLIAFQKVGLKPGESKTIHVTIDSRLLAMYHSSDKPGVLLQDVTR